VFKKRCQWVSASANHKDTPSLLGEMLATFPVVAVEGSRQVGKSALIQRPIIGRGRRYLTLDDISLSSVAHTDLPLSIDEVQLAPGLLREIKLRVNRDREPGRLLHVRTHDGLAVDGLLSIRGMTLGSTFQVFPQGDLPGD